MATHIEVQQVIDEAKGFEDALVSAYMSTHSPEFTEVMSTIVLARHVADCTKCWAAFMVRKSRLLELQNPKQPRITEQMLVDAKLPSADRTSWFINRHPEWSGRTEELMAIYVTCQGDGLGAEVPQFTKALEHAKSCGWCLGQLKRFPVPLESRT